jgi:hypothetical protein
MGFAFILKGKVLVKKWLDRQTLSHYNTDMNNKTDKDKSKIVIEGTTTEGEQFRPSDWAERISGKLATFRNQRVVYSPLLTPSIKSGRQCVILDEALKDSDPELYNQLIEFAKTNHLVMCDQIEDRDENSE